MTKENVDCHRNIKIYYDNQNPHFVPIGKGPLRKNPTLSFFKSDKYGILFDCRRDIPRRKYSTAGRSPRFIKKEGANIAIISTKFKI